MTSLSTYHQATELAKFLSQVDVTLKELGVNQPALCQRFTESKYSGLGIGLLFFPHEFSIYQAKMSNSSGLLISIHSPTGDDFECPFQALPEEVQHREQIRVNLMLCTWQQRQKQKPEQPS